MIKKPGLLILANSTQAHIYEVTKDKHIIIKELSHDQSRFKNQQLITDKPGRFQTSFEVQGKFIPTSNPHEAEHSHFAKTVANEVKKQASKKKYQDIALCAEPHFYGLLKESFSKSAPDLITKVIEKDYIPLPKLEQNAVIEDIIHEHF